MAHMRSAATVDSTVDEQIGARVHSEMWQRRVTQTALAKSLGVDQSTISKKLRGERPWFAAEVATAARTLGVTVADLYGEPTGTLPPAGPLAQPVELRTFNPEWPVSDPLDELAELIDLDTYRDRRAS